MWEINNRNRFTLLFCATWEITNSYFCQLITLIASLLPNPEVPLGGTGRPPFCFVFLCFFVFCFCIFNLLYCCLYYVFYVMYHKWTVLYFIKSKKYQKNLSLSCICAVFIKNGCAKLCKQHQFIYAQGIIVDFDRFLYSCSNSSITL